MYMRFSLVFLILILAKVVFAQPVGYYDNARNKTGNDLKDALHEIIKGHVEFPYTSSSTDVWDILKLTDRDPSDTTLVELIYSGALVNGAQEYNSGSGWTREHVWAKSRGNFGTSAGPGTDVHAIRPCYNSINSSRNNRAFNNCSSCNNVQYLGSNTGSFTDSNVWTFEPRDEMKGDVARMIFYMATRYEQEDGVDLELDDTIRSNIDQSPFHSVLTTLLIWNKLDKVSAKEKRRNNIIYDEFQKNRNPYIDHPELADYIFGNLKSVKWMAQTYVPDDNFENELIKQGYDAVLDDSVTTANINTVINLDVNSLNISDLTGIEDFTTLTRLDCEQNKLVTLDLSQNTALNYLDIDANALTALDLSSNIALTFFEGADNQLTSLDLSLNAALTEFYCENNQLTSLDFRNGSNTLVVDFSTIGNPNLTCINVDDAAYSKANWTNIDAQTSFNEDCSSVVGIKQYTSSKTLIKTFNIMGRETTFKPNTLLINVYDDGSAEKVFTKHAKE
jgi:endonuclease I